MNFKEFCQKMGFAKDEYSYSNSCMDEAVAFAVHYDLAGQLFPNESFTLVKEFAQQLLKYGQLWKENIADFYDTSYDEIYFTISTLVLYRIYIRFAQEKLGWYSDIEATCSLNIANKVDALKLVKKEDAVLLYTKGQQYQFKSKDLVAVLFDVSKDIKRITLDGRTYTVTR